MNKIISSLMIVAVFSVSIQTLAQDSESQFSESDLQTVDTSQHKKINVKFGDELVSGSAEKPEAEYLFQKSDFNFKKLIRLRENFIPEVQRGKDDMRGVK